MAAASGVTPRELPVTELQERLLAVGALGPRQRAELPAPRDEALHDASWVPAQPPALPLAELAAQLGGDDSQEATWQLVRNGEDALPFLLGAAEAAQPTRRFWASVGLAMLNRSEAAPELLAAVEERREDTPEGRKTAPLWMGAAVLLGRLSDPKAVPVLGGVLADPDAGLDALIAAVRSIGRIGDPAGIPHVDALLARGDVPTGRPLQVSGAGINPVVEDARWQLELAAAEALAAMGAPRPELARRHLGDDRALVRRQARRVLARSQG
jgi:HEAT repeat protein